MGRRSARSNRDQQSSVAVRVAVIGGVATVLAALIAAFASGVLDKPDRAVVAPSSTSRLPATRPSTTTELAEITQPKHGAKDLQRCTVVSGTASRTKPGYDLWLLVRAPDQATFYPVSAIHPDANGKWSQPVVLGARPPEDNGLAFELIVYLANPSASRAFLEVPQTPGFDERGMSVPPGATAVSSVVVWRSRQSRILPGCG